MPLYKDPNQGGTESNGSKSTLYCSFCYENGAFKADVPMEEFIKKVDDILREKRLPRVLRWMTKKQIPKLKRWAK